MWFFIIVSVFAGLGYFFYQKGMESEKKEISLETTEEKQVKIEKKVAIKKYVDGAGKSRVTSFILTLLFGPLGLFYSSIAGAIIMIIIGISLSAATMFVAAPIIWVLSIALGDHFTYKYNQKLLVQAEFMQSMK